MNEFDIAHLKYKPSKIKYLLIAETPPRLNSNRFFYFEDVNIGDSLFWETMKALYSKNIGETKIKYLRKNKRDFLIRFKEDGFYLIDSLDEPFESKYNTNQKVKLLQLGQHALLKKIKGLINDYTPIILISATVFKANYLFLKKSKLNIAHNELIDFPGSGGQKNFKIKFIKTYQQLNYIPSKNSANAPK